MRLHQSKRFLINDHPLRSYFISIACLGLLGFRLCMAQDSSADRAWNILDSVWHSGNVVEKQHVLGALAKVKSGRASKIFRQALEGAPALAGRAANLLTADRAMELEDVILKRLNTEQDTFARIQLVASLGKLSSEQAKAALVDTARVDHQPFTSVAFGVLQDMGPWGRRPFQPYHPSC
jgi:hypothetical protein